MPTGITKGAIIKAQDIYDRYSIIINNLIDRTKNLLEKANSNITASKHLTAQLNAFISDVNRNGSQQARDAFQYLQIASYHETTSTITSISSQLKTLETQWWGTDNSNSAHDGISAYDRDIGDYKTYDDRKKNPLHVIKKLNPNNNNYPADGRVNQSDFIGAYHFQATIESLYAIISRLRDIRIRIRRDNSEVSVNFGQDNPYVDIKTIKQHSNYILADGISANQLSVAVIPFHDWMLNNDLNGQTIRVGDDSSKQKHGWITSSTDSNLRYPSSLNDAMQNAPYFINTNEIGNQITRNLRNRSSEVEHGGTNEPSKISNFYYNGSDSSKYGKAPISGIANEYMTLKFGTDVEEFDGEVELSSYSTPSSELNRYFFKNVAEQYTGSGADKSVVTSTNVIRSKTTGKKHIVCASTVNEMFKKMNLMLVQISASLYGNYDYNFTEGTIIDYDSGNPIGGLGYPEIMSWYSGGHNTKAGVSSVIHILNRENQSVLTARTEVYSATLRNDSFVGLEKGDKRWDPIKCGYPWMTYSWRTAPSNDITSYEKIFPKLSGSIVPMAFNAGLPSIPSNPQIKKENLSDTTNASNSYFYGTSSNGIYRILNTRHSDAHSQVFTRYCISHPVLLSFEKNITASNGYYENKNVKNADINAKYLFMPYMMYLDDWYHYAHNNQLIGKFLTTNISVNKTANKFLSECGMPVQSVNRSDIWNKNKIIGGYSDINVALYIEKENLSNNDIVGSDHRIDSIKYSIKGVNTVNEVNHTHKGYSRLSLAIGYGNYGSSSFQTVTLPYISSRNDNSEIPYSGGGDGAWKYTYDNTSGSPIPRTELTSEVYYGRNSYKINKNDALYPFLQGFYHDAMDAMYYDRYKFNDFYDDNDLLTEKAISYENISALFACGEFNKYLGGNKTLFWRWNIEKTLSSGSRALQLYPYFHNVPREKDKHNDTKSMIQGNFFFSANHSNELKISKNNGATSYWNYKYIPMPNPITISAFNVDTESTTNNVLIRGFCSAWWNNLAKVQFNIKFNSTTSTEVSAKKIYTLNPSYGHADEKRPFKAVQVEEEVTFGSNPIIVHSKWDSSKQRFDFDISCSCTFPSDYEDILSVDYRFTNEDGGFREYTNQKVETTVSPNFSKSYSCLIPYFLRKVSDLVKIGDIVEPSALSSRSAAQNAISSTSYDGVSISSFSVLGWIRNVDESATITATDDTNLEVLSCNPQITAMGGWVGVKTKVMIPEQIADTLNDGQSIKLKVTFGSIRGDSGDGAGIFFGNENTALKDINSISPGDICDAQGFDENDKPWSNFDTDSFNATVLYRLVSKQFDNIDGINASNIISKGGKIIIQQDLERPDIGIIPDNRVFTFNKIFKVHKTSNTDCYIINNLFFELGGDSFVNPDGSGIDWGVFQIRLDKVI